MDRHTALGKEYRLEDRYSATDGRVYLTGIQALVRLPLEQARADRAAGLTTAGLISGYRGSPLGGYDQALWRERELLAAHTVRFQPAINEEAGATILQGSQQVESGPQPLVQGVFGLWYGKGPGLDRAGDALKHGHAYGSSPHGGVLVVAGDDHGVVSSSMSHQSDLAMIGWRMPVIHPASVADYIPFGLWGWAASRWSGAWIGFKAISDVVESGMSVDLTPLPRFSDPVPDQRPPGGLHYRWPDLPGPQIEARLYAKLDALHAFARTHPLDRQTHRGRQARIGIVAVGKAWHDVMAALARLGWPAHALPDQLAILKLGLVWPVEADGLRRFAAGLETLLVVEEKADVVESQLRSLFYDGPADQRPRILGKAILPSLGVLTPVALARALGPHLPGANTACLPALPTRQRPALRRSPYFCSGCPHNRSTQVPEGSRAQAGIGCHFMAAWMERDTGGLTPMGGEGVNWIGQSPFTGEAHIFQNLGDGTYFHSGSLAVRQAVAAGTRITFKLLFNDAVAMTGGQPVDGHLTVPQLTRLLHHDGVGRIAVVSEDPNAYPLGADFAPGVTRHGRDDLDAVQRDLRDWPGVSALVYDQTCAAEKRRRRKRGLLPTPDRRVVIHPDVCEGCGDCGVQSNCVSIQPLETPLGRKRMIDQTGCNQDFSCIEGRCPSFVSVSGVTLRRQAADGLADLLAQADSLPVPMPILPPGGWAGLLAGIGGTGIVTAGALVTMAAHLEGRAASNLDFMGFAQKGGAVLSHLRIAGGVHELAPPRLDEGEADLLLAADPVVATLEEAQRILSSGRVRVVADPHIAPTGAFTRQRDLDLAGTWQLDQLTELAGPEYLDRVAATDLTRHYLGDSSTANVFLLGYAVQKGLIPIGLAALDQAITLNKVAIAANRAAVALGRLAAAGRLPDPAQGRTPAGLAELIAARVARLTAYQSATYADTYRQAVDQVAMAEQRVRPGEQTLTRAVALSLFRLMAVKDEYEVARLLSDPGLCQDLTRQFDGAPRLSFHLSPPWARGERPVKYRFGPWLRPILRGLARLRVLRFTRFDPAAWSADRRAERQFLAAYQNGLARWLAHLTPANHADAVAWALLPETHLRGYGPVRLAGLRRAEAEAAKIPLPS